MQTKIYLASFEHEGKTYKGSLPVGGTMGAAGMDVSTPYSFTLKKGETHFVNTGLIIKAPRGYCIQILPRSGLSTKKGIMIPNAPGLVDRDYSGPNDIIRVALRNMGDKDVTFEEGDRVAQLLFTPYKVASWDEQDSSDFSSSQSRGGFGSTGINRIGL